MNSADVLARPQFPDSLLQIARASLPSTILTIWPLVTCHATLPLIKVRRRKNLAIFCSFSVLQEYTIMATLPVIGVRRKNLDMFAFAGIHLFPFPPSLSSSSPLYQVKNVWFRKNQSKESIFLKRAFMCCYSFWQVYSPPPCWAAPHSFIKYIQNVLLWQKRFFAKRALFCVVAAFGKNTPLSLPSACWAAPHPFIKSPDATATPLLEGAASWGGEKTLYFFQNEKYFFPKYEAYQASIHGWMGGVRKVIGQRVVCWLLLLTRISDSSYVYLPPPAHRYK